MTVGLNSNVYIVFGLKNNFPCAGLVVEILCTSRIGNSTIGQNRTIFKHRVKKTKSFRICDKIITKLHPKIFGQIVREFSLKDYYFFFNFFMHHTRDVKAFRRTGQFFCQEDIVSQNLDFQVVKLKIYRH